MNIKQIEKGQKYYQEIKSLDKQIAEIEKLAIALANKKCSVKLNLNVTDLEKENEEKEKVKFDEDGSIVVHGGQVTRMYFNAWGIDYGEKSISPQCKVTYSTANDFDISDTEALQVLGILIYSKQQKRKELIKKIEKL